MGAPARAMRSIWATQAAVSRVSVLVIDCTATGCVPPIVQAPMADFVRSAGAGIA